MTSINGRRVSASAIIEERARRVYEILADYRGGHPRILPKRYFRALEVMKGGTGEGTTLSLEMRVLGQSRFMRQVVTEPEPGRLLEETDLATGDVTIFLVESFGPFTRVTISTELKSRAGLRGGIGRWIAGLVLRRVYAQELKLLADYCFRDDSVPAESPEKFRPRSVVA